MKTQIENTPKLLRSNRDFFRIGVGVDVFRLFKRKMRRNKKYKPNWTSNIIFLFVKRQKKIENLQADVEVGKTYIITAFGKRYTFSQPSQVRTSTVTWPILTLLDIQIYLSNSKCGRN